MANTEKPKRIVTPVGIAQYPWLQKPKTVFKEEGEYTTNLILSQEDAQPILDEINKMTEEAFAEYYNQAKPAKRKSMTKHYPYEPEIDEATEEPTGNIILKFKTSATIKNKRTGEKEPRTLPIFDKAGKPVPTNKPIYTGSKIRINFTPVPYYVAATNLVGVTLYLNAVQVLEFAPSGGSAARFGFDVVEDEEDMPFEMEGSEGLTDEEDF